MEKARLPSPAEHPSYQLHRRQLWTQILIPILVAVLVLVAIIVLISVATFRDGGEVERWAAISTIWIVIPILLAGLILLLVLIGLIYLMARALTGLPYYTGIAQDYVYKARGYIIRAADMAAKPILALDGWLESIKAFFGRMTP